MRIFYIEATTDQLSGTQAHALALLAIWIAAWEDPA